MKTYLPLLCILLLIVIFSSCRNDNATPIRNVRFDPGLLNPAQAGGGVPCVFHNYYYNEQPKTLGNVYSRMILVAFNEGYTYEQALAVAGKYGFIEGLGQEVRTNSARLYPVKLEDGLNCKQVEQAIEVLEQDAGVTYAAPYFLTEDGGKTQLLGISNEFIVTLNDRQQAGVVLERLADATRTSIVATLSKDTYVLRADKNSRGNALEMANFFHEQAPIQHAEPDFVVSLEM
jgi:hypothetical protein